MSLYHFELIIILNHEHEFKSGILARHIFYQIGALDIQANLCENNLYPDTIKNYNGAVAIRGEIDANGGNNSTFNIILDELCNYVIDFLIYMKLKAFCVTQNETPKIANNVHF